MLAVIQVIFAIEKFLIFDCQIAKQSLKTVQIALHFSLKRK